MGAEWRPPWEFCFHFYLKPLSIQQSRPRGKSALSLGHPSQCRLLGVPFPEGESGLPWVSSLQSTPFIPLCSHTVCIY